jgi:uncharacterized repeat protein (TIGR03803 family)
MKEKVRSIRQVGWFWMAGVLAVFAVALILPMPAAGRTYKVLHKFTGKNGANPSAALILDTAGNLYGTTAAGGANGFGTVFELKPNPEGSWTESVLYSFCSLQNCVDGALPLGSLIFDSDGNLYGTTDSGGANASGIVFKLAPNPDGIWTESVLHSFTGGSDGRNPNAGLIADSDGNLYGTTNEGGIINHVCDDYVGCGVVFKLTRDAAGGWTESVLYAFCLRKNCSDGWGPTAAVTLDTKGNLYGTTSLGGYGAYCDVGPGCGTVFELTPNPHGGWTHSVLYNFCTHNNSDRDCTDGSVLLAGVIFDAAGNLYGTTEAGGSSPNCGGPPGGGCGVVFELTSGSDGQWSETVIHNFHDHPAAYPSAALVFDSAGDWLYGTSGGNIDGGSTVFGLSPGINGGWTYNVLHTFHGKLGINAYGGLVSDKTGNLYGTTDDCGDQRSCSGVVFQVSP